jgi:hypothetical protein
VPVFLHIHCTHARDGPFFPRKIAKKSHPEAPGCVQRVRGEISIMP